MCKQQTSINRIRRQYPICEGFKGDEGFDDRFFDEPEEYDHEEDVPDYERV